ncbi:hypothetical protein KPATCC21470_2911 [Kitasatospora purpeofusca]
MPPSPACGISLLPDTTSVCAASPSPQCTCLQQACYRSVPGSLIRGVDPALIPPAGQRSDPLRDSPPNPPGTPTRVPPGTRRGRSGTRSIRVRFPGDPEKRRRTP